MNHRESDELELVDAFKRLRADDLRRTPDAADVLARARREVDAVNPRPEIGSATAAPGGAGHAVVAGRVARPGRTGRRRWAVPGLGIAMAAAIAAILLVNSGDDTGDFDRVVEAWSETGGSWQAPTDGLLRMPGDELLRAMPRIGGFPTSSPSALDAPVFDDSGRENPS